MTYDERRAIRILISEARRQQVANAHGRNNNCGWCGDPYTPTVPNRRYCTQRCASQADYHRRKQTQAVA